MPDGPTVEIVATGTTQQVKQLSEKNSWRKGILIWYLKGRVGGVLKNESKGIKGRESYKL